MPSYDRGYPLVAVIARRDGGRRRAENTRTLGLVLPAFEHALMASDRVLDASDIIPLDATEQPIEDPKPAIADDHHEASVSD
jgi:hypothetical protein